MRAFKDKYCTVARAVSFLLVVFLLTQLCNFLFATENTYTRVMLHELYESQDNIDVVFVGSSTTYRNFTPEIWDNALDLYSFNLGSSNQTLDSSYYLLNELFALQKPRYCILGLSYVLFMDLDVWNNPTGYYILSDYLKPSYNKLQYLLHSYDEKTICPALFPFLRNKSAISLGLVRDNLKKKLSESYKNYGYDIFDTTSESYMGRGFVYARLQTTPGAVGQLREYPFSEESISSEFVDYLHKIAQLCKEHDCELILVAPPLPYAHMALQEDYQTICSFYQQLAIDNDVMLFDFTLARPELLSLDDSSFYDWIHMNGEGAAAFSSAAAQVTAAYINGEEIDYDKLFYSSYQELLDASPYIFNAWLTKADGVFTANCTFGSDVIPEYQFAYWDSEDSDWHILREYSSDKTLESYMVPETAVELRLYVRPAGSEDSYQQSDTLKLSA